MREMSSEDRHAKALSRAILTVWIFFGVSYLTRPHELLGEQVAPRGAVCAAASGAPAESGGAEVPEEAKGNVCKPASNSEGLSEPPQPKYEEKTIAEWIELLKVDDLTRRDAARAALIRIGVPAVPSLMELLKSNDDTARHWASATLSFLSPTSKGAAPALAELLADSNPDVRHAAGGVLWHLHSEAKAAVPILRELLRNKDREIRLAALSALGAIGRDAGAASPDVMRLLGDHDAGVRSSAALIIGNIRCESDKAVPALLETMIKDKDSNVRSVAALALGDFGVEAKTATPPLTKALDDENIDMRTRAALALGRIGGAIAQAGGDSKPMIAALADRLRAAKSVEARDSFASGLGQVGPPAVPTLMELLGESEERRLAALHGFAFVKPDDAKPAVGALTRLLSDRNPEIRGNAAAALGAIGSAAVSALPALERMARDDPDFRDHDTRRTAGGAVERIKEDNSKE